MKRILPRGLFVFLCLFSIKGECLAATITTYLIYEIAIEPEGTTTDITLHLPIPTFSEKLAKELVDNIKKQIEQEIEEREERLKTIEKGIALAIKEHKEELKEYEKELIKESGWFVGRLVWIGTKIYTYYIIKKTMIEPEKKGLKKLKRIRVKLVKTRYGEMLKIYVPGRIGEILKIYVAGEIGEIDFDAFDTKKEFNIIWKGEIPFSSNERFEIASKISGKEQEILHKTYRNRYTISVSSVPIYARFNRGGIKMKIRYSVKNRNEGKNYFIGDWEVGGEGIFVPELIKCAERLRNTSSIKKSGWHTVSMAEERYIPIEKENITPETTSIFWLSSYPQPSPPSREWMKKHMPELSNEGEILSIIGPPSVDKK